jgi:3'-phosphoadenosine 5'-phosphosulfate sulfotransferase (PAPS reductase)/FAD synthetase
MAYLVPRGGGARELVERGAEQRAVRERGPEVVVGGARRRERQRRVPEQRAQPRDRLRSPPLRFWEKKERKNDQMSE